MWNERARLTSATAMLPLCDTTPIGPARSSGPGWNGRSAIRRAGFRKPRVFGPSTTVSPASANCRSTPEVNTTAAGTPAAATSAIAAGTASTGTMTYARSGTIGRSATPRYSSRPCAVPPLGFTE